MELMTAEFVLVVFGMVLAAGLVWRLGSHSVQESIRDQVLGSLAHQPKKRLDAPAPEDVQLTGSDLLEWVRDRAAQEAYERIEAAEARRRGNLTYVWSVIGLVGVGAMAGLSQLYTEKLVAAGIQLESEKLDSLSREVTAQAALVQLGDISSEVSGEIVQDQLRLLAESAHSRAASQVPITLARQVRSLHDAGEFGTVQLIDSLFRPSILRDDNATRAMLRHYARLRMGSANAAVARTAIERFETYSADLELNGLDGAAVYWRMMHSLQRSATQAADEVAPYVERALELPPSEQSAFTVALQEGLNGRIQDDAGKLLGELSRELLDMSPELRVAVERGRLPAGSAEVFQAPLDTVSSLFASRLDGESTTEPGRDWWRFIGSVGDTVWIVVSSEEFDPVVQVASPSGESSTNDDGWCGTDSALEVNISSTEPYAVFVDAWGVGGGEFRIRLATTEIPRECDDQMDLP